MDQATIMRILERQGAPDTPDNVNRIIQAAASDPSILERYSLGTAPAQMQQGPTGTRDIRGGAGLDDNSALLALDRSIRRTNSTQQMEAAPPPASAPTPRTSAPRKPGIPGDANRPVGAPPFPQAAPPPPGVAYEPSTGAPIPVPSGMAESRAVPPDQASPGGVSLDPYNWLLAAAGLRALQKPPELPPPFERGGPPAVRTPPEATYVGPMGRDAPPAQLEGPRTALPPPATAPDARAAARGDTRLSASPGPDPATGDPMMKPGPGQTPQEVRNLYGDKNYENEQALKNEIAKQNPEKPRVRVRAQRPRIGR